MLVNVANPNRIGWEAEIRTATFVKPTFAHNKVVLAQSGFNIVDTGLNYNFLQIVTEGQGTGDYYIELVFGPLPFGQTAIVQRIVNAANAIRITSGMTLQMWVNQLNVTLATISAAHQLACIAPFQTEKLKGVSGKVAAPSLQANIAVRLDSLTSDLYDRWFNGTAYEYEALFPKIRNHVSALGLGDGNLRGAVILATYICAIVAKLDKAMTATNINKQFFHILPKTSLKRLFGDIPPPTAVTPANVAAALNALVAAHNLHLFDIPRIETQFYANLTFSAAHIAATPLAVMLNLHPRPAAVLDTMSNGAGFYIILEMRKSTLIMNVYNGQIRLRNGIYEIG